MKIGDGCGACGLCAETCNYDAIIYPDRTDGGYTSPVIDQNRCIECGDCAEVCPMECIK